MLKRERGALRIAVKIQRAGTAKDVRLTIALKEMLKMGGLYVKFAQMMLLNQVFSKSVPSGLRRDMFDRVKIDGHPRANHFFSPLEMSRFASSGLTLNDTPSYSGSFAAVFEARYQDRQLVIKVIRPELRRQLRQDLRLMGMVSKSIGLFKSDLQAALKDAYSTFKHSVLSETDYITEARLAQEQYNHYLNDPTIIIPMTYMDLCSAHFIVQDKLEGVWLSELMQNNLSGPAAADYVIKRTGSNLPTQLYNLGYRNLYDSLSGRDVHGDPHPGNVVLMEGNKVGLIDFGVIAKPVKNRLALLEYIKEQIRGSEGDIDVPRLMLSIVRFHASNLYQALESLSKYYKRPLLNDLYKFLQAEVSKSSDAVDESMVPTGQYSDMLSASINKNNRFGLLPKVDTPITQKAFITLWRTFDELGYMPITFQVFNDVVRDIEQDNNVDDWKEKPMSTSRALEVIGEWLSLVSEKDPQLFRKLSRLIQNPAPKAT